VFFFKFKLLAMAFQAVIQQVIMFVLSVPIRLAGTIFNALHTERLIELALSAVRAIFASLKTWVVNSPISAAFQVLFLVIGGLPGMFSGWLLWLLGWTAQGPRAGEGTESNQRNLEAK